MKIFFYTLREFDELACAKECSAKTGIAFDYTTAYPSAENAALARGYEAISMTPCDMSAPMLERFASKRVNSACGSQMSAIRRPASPIMPSC